MKSRLTQGFEVWAEVIYKAKTDWKLMETTKVAFT